MRTMDYLPLEAIRRDGLIVWSTSEPKSAI
jgi:hypothetical protein